MKRGVRTALDRSRPAGVFAALASGLLLAACACGHPKGVGSGSDGSGSDGSGSGGSGSGSAGSGSGSAADCEPARANITALYQAESTVGTAAKNATFVADNVAMVMADCAADPGKVASCAGAARSVADLERDCLVPIDDEGSEGDRLAK